MTDIVTIGDATLYLGDCLEILPTIGNVDAVVTDPPYGIGIKNNGQENRNRTEIRGDGCQAAGINVMEWAEKRDLMITMFASPRLIWPGQWRNLIVWDKGGGVGGGGDLKVCLKLTWELIQVARNKVINNKRDVSVWRHVVTQNNFYFHSCEKPIGLMDRLISTFTLNSDIILDPFMGSGSTGVACANLGRKFIGIEIEPKYFDIACQRIEAAYAQGRLFA